MTALLYKDLFLLLRQLRWFLLAVLALLLLPLLFRISVVHGQLWSLLVLLVAILLALNLLTDLNPNNPYAVLPLLLPGLLRAAPLALLAGAVANGISVALSLRLVAQPTP